MKLYNGWTDRARDDSYGDVFSWTMSEVDFSEVAAAIQSIEEPDFSELTAAIQAMEDKGSGWYETGYSK